MENFYKQEAQKKEGRPMAKMKIQLPQEEALHARMAAAIVKSTQGVEAEVTISDGQATVPAESVLLLITLDAGPGTVLTAHASGPHAEKAVSMIRETVENYGKSHAAKGVANAGAPLSPATKHPKLCAVEEGGINNGHFSCRR